MKALRETNKERRFKRWGRGVARGTPRCDREAGQALVELALLMPMLLLIFLGTVEFGRLTYIIMEVSSAAHAAAEYGSQSVANAADTTGMTHAAQQDAPELPDLTVATPTETCQCSSAAGTNITCSTAAAICTSPSRVLVFVNVQTSASYKPIFFYTGHTGTITLTGNATMPVGN